MNKEDFIKVINGLDIKTIEGFCLRITNSDNEKGFIQQGLEYIELQQRIDKAKKYIKKQSGWNRISCYGIDSQDVFELLDILRGEDNDKS